MAQEEDAIVGADGKVRWALKRQDKLFLVGGFAPPRVVAQPSIVGQVVDPDRSAIPGAEVLAIAPAGSLAYRTQTGRDGRFQFDHLPEGNYRIDASLAGFNLTRRNNIRVTPGATATTTLTLTVGMICECVMVPPGGLSEREGQVTDESQRPLPFAELTLETPSRREIAYADADGYFRVRLSPTETWTMAASRPGFSAVTRQVSGRLESLRFILPKTDGIVPDEERFSRGCRCAGDLFTHKGR
jgi:hypothetical protein